MIQSYTISKRGFTLVELIVVITILAILGTIAFISLQKYTGDARNSKRISDIGSIASAMTSEITQGASLLGFVNSDPNAHVVNISIAGSGALTGTTLKNYDAGKVNYVALGIRRQDFLDPVGSQDYAMGATTLINGRYQLATKIESGGGAFIARVFGDYNPRTFTGGSNAVSITSTGTNNKVTIVPLDIGKLKAGDTVNGGRKVSKISSDGRMLFLSSAFNSTGTSILGINAPESAGLIDARLAGTGIIVTDGSRFFPY